VVNYSSKPIQRSVLKMYFEALLDFDLISYWDCGDRKVIKLVSEPKYKSAVHLLLNAYNLELSTFKSENLYL